MKLGCSSSSSSFHNEAGFNIFEEIHYDKSTKQQKRLSRYKKLKAPGTLDRFFEKSASSSKMDNNDEKSLVIGNIFRDNQ